MKVYFVYEGEPSDQIVGSKLHREAYKVKITVPEKWLSGPCSKLLSFFCETYNKKFSATALVAEEMQMKCGGIILPATGTVSQYVQEYNDISILHVLAVKKEKRPEGSVLCTNYGCGKYYLEEENGPEACKHHAQPPVFHDTYKYWNCCPTGKALDWEEFENLPTCCVGPHSSTNKPVVFKQEELAAQALTEDQRKAMEQGATPQEAMAGARRCGPREFEQARDEAPQEIVDGKAKCRNFGCQQEFVVAENHASACQHHAEGPVFWDTYKYWKCCPQCKHADFDDFVKVPGCVVGPHKL